MESDTTALLSSESRKADSPRAHRSPVSLKSVTAYNSRGLHHSYRLNGTPSFLEADADEGAASQHPVTAVAEEGEDEMSEPSNTNSFESHIRIPSSQSSKPIDVETAPTRNRSRKSSLLPPAHDTARALPQTKSSKASKSSRVDAYESHDAQHDDVEPDLMSSLSQFPHPLEGYPTVPTTASRKSSSAGHIAYASAHHNDINNTTVPLRTKASFQVPIMSYSTMPNGAPQLAVRKHFLERNTKETKIQVLLSIDGGPLELLPQPESPLRDSRGGRDIPNQHSETHASQESPSQTIWVWTGVGFLDHMLHAWAKHAGWSLRLRARGDLEIDDHHTVEDTFLALGSTYTACLGPRTGLQRFGHAYAPLDEALSRAVIDLSNRAFFVGTFDFKGPMLGKLNTQMVHHGLHSWSQAAGVTLHVDVLRGDNDHHRCESAFKALAGACRMAGMRVEGREGEAVSTKGVL